jgi:uncharacterized protein
MKSLCLGLAMFTTASAFSAEFFPPAQVRIDSGPFATAIEANAAYLLAHDPDRLMAPFRREAGLPPRADSYGNWENTGLDGHTAGHYLSALAYMAAATGRPEFRERLDAMVAELAECQQALGTGYIGGVPRSRELWEEIREGRIHAGAFSLNDRWVPWYNLHKTFAGLRDAWWIAGNEQAKTSLVTLADWCEQLVSGLSDQQLQDMLRSEHGGMNEVLADVAVISGDERYLALARRFSHRAILDPLVRGEDRLTGQHANTQIPKVIGFARIAALAHDTSYASAARFFWERVVRHRSVVFGGNSVAEHFNPPEDFRGMLEHREGPESCNTYNMLRLTEHLFLADPQAAYADYYERALLNHILSTIHPEDPGYVYFTPIRPGHYRVYSVPERHFWCCVGSGMENPGRYGDFIYARDPEGLFVNLYMASTLTWPERGLTLRQETDFPDQPRSRLRLSLENPAPFALRLRHPGWAAAGFRVSINGETFATDSRPSSYVTLEREWRDGDLIEIDLPMETRLEALPDDSSWVAILHGPILLAAEIGRDGLTGLRAGDSRFSHVAQGPLRPLDQLPALVAESPEAAVASIKPVPNEPLTFTIDGAIRPDEFTGTRLVPFFRLHDARYQMYWHFLDDETYAVEREKAAAAERDALALEAVTIGRVRPGEQQPEVEHNFRGEETQAGEWSGRRFRHGRWFSYEFRLPEEVSGAELLLTYWGGDDRTFDILLNDQLLTTEHLRSPRPGQFIEVRHAIPGELLAAARGGSLTVKFAAHPGSMAGGIYDIRLIRTSLP